MLFINDFIDSRIQKITADMRKTNGEYANAVQKRHDYFEQIDPVISRDKELLVSPSDFANIRDYHEQEFLAVAIEHEGLYKQGYLDCITLLKMLGVL